jgi:ankyrin repeat protein
MVTTRQQARRGARGVSERAIAKKRSSDVSNKYRLSARIIILIEQNATDQEIEKELSRNNSRLPFQPLADKDAFYHAATKERYKIVPLLLERQDNFNWNSLHLAVAYNDENFILQHFGSRIPELGCLGEENDTPLHLAFRMGNAKKCKFLLENGCWERYTGDDKDCIGHIAIEEIAFNFNKNVWEWAAFVAWLYTKGGMSLDTKTSKGQQTVEDLMSRWEIPLPIKTVIKDIKSGRNLGDLLQDLDL